MVAELVMALEAEHDLAEAYAWYEGWRTGLGEEFLSCVDACIQAIRRTPEMHAVVHENYRRGLVALLSICGLLRACRGHGDRLRRISHLSQSR